MEDTAGDCTKTDEGDTSSEKVTAEKKSQKDSRQRKKHLIHQITAQMDFYFSSANITKDPFMLSLLEDGPYINLETFFKFNRIRALTDDVNLLRKAVSKSTLLKLSDDGLKVKRRNEIERKDNEIECTIYIENIPSHGDHDWIRQVLAQYGTIDYVSLPRYRRSGRPKGFAFVEFKTPEMANSALEAFGALECRIPTTIDPSQLQSIKTYEGNVEDQLSTHEQTSPGTFSGIKKQNIVKDCGEDINLEMKTEVENEKDMQVGEGRRVEFSKKRKKVEDEEEGNNSDCDSYQPSRKRKLDVTVDDTSLITSTEKEENPVMESVSAVSSKKNKKKKRKRNKKEKEVVVESIYLRVMSKEDWKMLRNQYLNMQRENMKSLKRQLQARRNLQIDYSDYCNPNFIKLPNECDQDQKFNTTADIVSNENRNSKPQFIPNAIIKISFEEPPQDPKKLCETIRQGGGGGVAYVDVSATERDVYVRFISADAASAYKKAGCWSRMEVLSGTQEQEYWDRITTCWSQLRRHKNKQSCKATQSYSNQVRGREKLLQKAFREAHNTKLNSHIIFES